MEDGLGGRGRESGRGVGGGRGGRGGREGRRRTKMDEVISEVVEKEETMRRRM